MNTPVSTVAKDALKSDTEGEILAREMAAAFGRLVKYYRDHYGLSPEEARQRCEVVDESAYLDSLLTRPPDQVSWITLENLGQRNPELARQCWEDVKAAALEELQTGHHAAKIIEAGGADCWDRAKFLAVRCDLAAEWQPRNGIEGRLVDVMAQAQTAYSHWLGTLMARTMLETMTSRELQEEKGRWNPPRVTDAEALEQAAAMVDRFNRIFLRTLRALRDLRRDSQHVIVQSAAQVNIAEKQINFSNSVDRPGKKLRSALK